MRGRGRQLAVIGLVLLAAACHKREKSSATTTTSANEPATKAASGGTDERLPAALTDGPPPLLAPMVKFLPADGLRAPASIIHDEASDAYLVSNMDGPPTADDGKGFISKLSPDGKKILARWIESGKNKVVLNAPKGMALRGDELWVADLDKVRIFHRILGIPLGEVEVPGAKFLADVTLSPDGAILVSDAALKANARGELEESGTGAVYAIYRDKTTTSLNLVVKDLHGPKALFAMPDKTWTVAFGSGDVLSIDAVRKLGDVQRLPRGELEGIVAVDDDLLVASRAANAIFQGRPNGKWRILVGDVKSPGDIGFDRKRRRLLVPLVTEDEVRVYGSR